MDLLDFISPEDVRTDPFPHFAKQVRIPGLKFPRAEDFRTRMGPRAERTIGPTQVQRILWRDMIRYFPEWEDFVLAHTSHEFYQKVAALFDLPDKPSMRRGGINQSAGKGTTDATPIQIDCQIVRQFVPPLSTPHIDRPGGLFVLIWYHPAEGDSLDGREIVLYDASKLEQKDFNCKSYVRKESCSKLSEAVRVPYASQTLVGMKVLGERSVHFVNKKGTWVPPRQSVTIGAETTPEFLRNWGYEVMDLPGPDIE